MQVETAIGLRYLQSKKRTRFLSVITFISIAGVALGVATLVVVLSVMEGFEQDLKSKILGANAHGVVLKFGTDFAEYRDIQQKAEKVKGVSGAEPFVLGEVMISVPLMTTGSLLKGINPETVSNVSDLKKNIVSGSLRYLEHPEEIPLTPLIIDDEDKKEAKEPAPTEKKADSDVKKEPQIQKATGDENDVDVFEEMEEGEGEAGKKGEENKVLPGVIIGQEMAKMLRVFVGDVIHIISPLGDGTIGPMGPIPKARTFRVAGIFFSGFYEYDAKLVYITLKEAQSFFALGDTVSGVEIKVRDVDTASDAMKNIYSAIGGYPFRTRDWQQMNHNLFSALRLEKIVMFIILIFIVLVASFNIISTLYMFVTEKEKEIAIMKSMGASNGMVSRIFTRIGLIIGGIGTAIGLMVGWCLCLFVEVYGIKLDPDVYYIDRLPVVTNWVVFMIVAVSAVTISFLATLPPSYLAARMRPVEGLRYD